MNYLFIISTYICAIYNLSIILITNLKRHLMIKSIFDSVYTDDPINYTAGSYDIKVPSTEKCNSIKKGIIKKYQKSSYSNHNRIIIES